MDSLEQQSVNPNAVQPGQNRVTISFSQQCPNCQMALPAGARFCMNCGQALGQRTATDESHLTNLAAAAPSPLVSKVRAAADLTGERRLVTAVFVDIVNSTTLAARVGSANWSALMDKTCEWFCSVIYRYEGTIARFVGDELLAFFGAPVAHEDDPLRAVHAALEILETVKQHAAQIRQDFGIDFAVRISLSTGPVIVGPISSDLRFDYSALQGTLNLVTQLEATKHAMAVLVSEETYRLTAPFFNFVKHGAVEIKGETEAVHIYQVIRAKADARRTRSLSPGLQGVFESPMVGRDSELKALIQLTQTVAAGLGRAALIVGESGLGKTRLIAEWKSAVVKENNDSPPEFGRLQWAEGHCLSYGQGLAYHLLRDLLRSICGISAAASEPETRSVLHSRLAALFGNTVLDVYPYLGHLLSITLKDEALRRVQLLDPPALRAQYLAACKRLLLALAARGPLLLLLEDLQWADPSSINIINQLLPLADDAPLLFCLVTRLNRDQPGWQLVTSSRSAMGGRFLELRLDNLTADESRQIIASLLKIDVLPQNIERLILNKAEGNPLFIEEVLRMMIDQGAIQQRNGRWAAGPEISTTGIPDSLQGLLLARLDRLPDGAKQTLRVAAVVGRRFPVPVLNQVINPRTDGHSEMTLINHLGHLESSGLIAVYQVKPELTYRFHNTLLQDAVYNSLLTADRQRLHLSVAKAMEQLYPASLEKLAPQLADHYQIAGSTVDAYKYFVLAGDTALNTYANQEAENRYRQALELAPTPSAQARLIYKIGQALYWQSHFQEAVQVWHKAIELYRTLADYDGLARLYARSTRALWDAGDTSGGLKLSQEGLAAVTPQLRREAFESRGLALLLHEAARAHLFNGFAAEAHSLCQQALKMAERLEDVTVQSEALATLGLMPDQSPETALAALSRAADLAESANLLSQAARAHINLAALMATAMPDFSAAQRHYRRAAELQRLRGNPAGELLGMGGMVGVMLESGRLDDVQKTLPMMRRLLNELTNPGPAAFHIHISEALLKRYHGQLGEAAEILSSLQTAERQRGNLQNLLDVNIQLVETVLESHVLPGTSAIGELAQAEAASAEAIEISDHLSASATRPRCLLSMVYTVQGNFADARRALSEAEVQVDTQPAAPDAGWPSLAAARLANAEKRWPEALALFAQTAGIFDDLDMRWSRARVLVDWAEALAFRREPTDLEQARTLLQEAVALFTAMGVFTYRDLAEERLQAIEVAAYAQALDHQKVDQEMAAAGRIQTGFLPVKPPQFVGWQLSAALEPSRQTSGDFYDFISLHDGRFGIVIADVADKGAAAALFMALTSTLIRTYAADYTAQPERVILETNRRILTDTHTDQFVTIFYAVFDPASGTLQYTNAGHNPPYLFQGAMASVRSLNLTGIPVGIIEEATWTRGTIQLSPGDVLLLYTDGVIDAQNNEGTFFDTERLLATVQANLGRSAQELQEAILTAIHQFSGGVPQFDDIALILLRRLAS